MAPTPSARARALLAGVLLAIGSLVGTALTVPAEAAPLTKVRPFKSGQRVAGKPLPQGQVQLRWGAVRRAKRYQVQWARNAKFRNAEKRLVKRTRLRLRGLAIGERYFIRVRAIRGKKRGRWSRTIRTVTRPKRPGPFPAGSIRTSRVEGGVGVEWGPSVNATRYRVQAGPFAGAATLPGPWLGAGVRSTVATGREVDLTVPRFGNPLVTNVVAGNVHAPKKARRGPTWQTTLPGAPAPRADALPVTVGTYNILCDGCSASGRTARPWKERGPEIAHRLEAAGVDVAVLQEVQNDTGEGQLYARFATTIEDTIGGDWELNSEDRYDDGVQGSRILYNAEKFTQIATETLTVPNRRADGVTHVPASVLQSIADPTVNFLVVSLHLGHGGDIRNVAQLERLGRDVRGLDDQIDDLRAQYGSAGEPLPVVLGGDLYSNQTAERQRAVGPLRTFAAEGWWDSRQAQRLHPSTAYSSTNHFAAQKKHASGFGYRVDYLLSKGIGTQTRRYGVHPETSDDAPSDHNLVWAEFAVPRG